MGCVHLIGKVRPPKHVEQRRLDEHAKLVVYRTSGLEGLYFPRLDDVNSQTEQKV